MFICADRINSIRIIARESAESEENFEHERNIFLKNFIMQIPFGYVRECLRERTNNSGMEIPTISVHDWRKQKKKQSEEIELLQMQRIDRESWHCCSDQCWGKACKIARLFFSLLVNSHVNWSIIESTIHWYVCITADKVMTRDIRDSDRELRLTPRWMFRNSLSVLACRTKALDPTRHMRFQL